MAENNESIRAIPDSILQEMEFLDNYNTENERLPTKELMEIYSRSHSLVQELENDYEGKVSNKVIKEYKRISQLCALQLKEQGLKDFAPDPTIRLHPEYLTQKFDQKLRLFNSLAENDAFLYNAKDLPEDLLSDDGFSLLTVNLIEDLEKILRKRAEDQSFVPGDKFYEQTYKNVIEKAIDFSETNEAPRYLKVFLGEASRLSMIEKTFSEDSADPARRIMTVNLDLDKISEENIGQRNINPETLLYHIRRNHTESDSDALEYVIDENGNYTARIAELKLLDDAVKKDPSLLSGDYKGELEDLMNKVREYEEELEEDNPEGKQKYDEVEELIRDQDIVFDRTAHNRELLKKSIYERGYAPDGRGSWAKNSEEQENSIKVLADWEKKFQERLIELDAAEYRTFEKIKKRGKNEIDMTNSSLFTTSMVLKDYYGNPETVMYNVSRLNKSMEFTGSGLGKDESYELAALNARKNNWKTVTLQYNGEPKNGVMFMEKSIMALVNTGGYSFDDIKVPKKYANVLQKIRENSFIMSEEPQKGTEQDYVSGGEYTKDNEQEILNANERTGQKEEVLDEAEPKMGSEVENIQEEATPEAEIDFSAQEMEPDIDDDISAFYDMPEGGINMTETDEALREADADLDAQLSAYSEDQEFDEFEDLSMPENINANKEDLPLNTHSERSSYRPVRNKK